MNKNKSMWWIVGAVVVVVVVVAIVALHGGGGGPASNSSSTAGTSGNQVDSASTGTGPAMSLTDLLSSGKSEQCGFSTQNPNAMTVAGTVYVTPGHLRGDFSAQTASGTVASHMITDGTNAWVWTDNMAQGYEMSFASLKNAQANAQANAQTPQSVNPTTKVNYSCTGWAVDQSEFTPPSNVTFENMTSMMNAAAGASAGASAGGGSSAQMCAMCAQAGSASAVAACKSAMHC